MSSILKALKKVEGQSLRSDSFFTMPKTIDKNKANRSKARPRWFIPGFITVVSILLIIVIAAFFLYNRQKPIVTKKFPLGVPAKENDTPASLLAKSNIFKAKIPPKSKNPTKSLPEKNQLTKNSIKSTEPASKVKKPPGKGGSNRPTVIANRQNPKPKPTVRSPQSGTAIRQENSLPKKQLRQDTAVSPKKVTARNAPSANPVKKTKKPDKARTYDRIDNTKLKLQALAWFGDASKRMAVINSRIVREGGSVDGYQVTQIRRQDVIVNDGKKSWRLEFGLKH